MARNTGVCDTIRTASAVGYAASFPRVAPRRKQHCWQALASAISWRLAFPQCLLAPAAAPTAYITAYISIKAPPRQSNMNVAKSWSGIDAEGLIGLPMCGDVCVARSHKMRRGKLKGSHHWLERPENCRWMDSGRRAKPFSPNPQQAPRLVFVAACLRDAAGRMQESFLTASTKMPDDGPDLHLDRLHQRIVI